MGGRAPGPAAEPRRPRGCGRPGAAQGHSARTAAHWPGQRPSARLQAAGARPPPHCAPERPGPLCRGRRGPSRRPSAVCRGRANRRAARAAAPRAARPRPRPPTPASSEAAMRVLQGPGHFGQAGTSLHGGSGRVPGPLRGLDSASLLPTCQDVCDTALLQGRERETGTGPDRGSWATDPTPAVEQIPAYGRRGLPGCSWAAVFWPSG